MTKVGLIRPLGRYQSLSVQYDQTSFTKRGDASRKSQAPVVAVLLFSYVGCVRVPYFPYIGKKGNTRVRGSHRALFVTPLLCVREFRDSATVWVREAGRFRTRRTVV
jgi:hypothetical protein